MSNSVTSKLLSTYIRSVSDCDILLVTAVGTLLVTAEMEVAVLSNRRDGRSEVCCVKCVNADGKYRVARGRREERLAQTIAVPTSIMDQFREPID